MSGRPGAGRPAGRLLADQLLADHGPAVPQRVPPEPEVAIGWALDDVIPVTNPSVFVMGKPGIGKSSSVKKLVVR